MLTSYIIRIVQINKKNIFMSTQTMQDGFQVVPQVFVCPVSRVFMRDPVVNKNGVSFQRSAITKWILQNGTDPFTTQKMQITDLRDDLVLRQAIQKYVEQLVKQQRQNLSNIEKQNLDLALGILGNYILKNSRNIQQLATNSLRKSKQNFTGPLNLAVIFQSLQIDKLSAEIKKLRDQLSNRKNLKKGYQQQQMEKRSEAPKNISVQQSDIYNVFEAQQAKFDSMKIVSTTNKSQQTGNYFFNKTLIKQKCADLQPYLIGKTVRKLIFNQFKITIDTNTQSWLQNQYTKSDPNVCIQNYNYSDWLRSAQVLPQQSCFYFKFSILKTQNFSIDFGVIDAAHSESQENLEIDNLSNAIYYNIQNKEVNSPQEKIVYDTADAYLREQPDFISVYIDRLTNDIEWHFNGRQQARFVMPQSWKYKKLNAIVKNQSKGFKIAFL